jgi:DNA-binding beta-propeller fold protein YncE
MILKVDTKGKLIKQLGGLTVSKGSTDTNAVNKPGDLFVYPKTNELFVADGYGNRRVIVFDADTLAFKRMWGAFGKPPKDDEHSGGIGALGGKTVGRTNLPQRQGPLDTEGPGADTFDGPVHGIIVSNDDLVYVCDRPNRRVQVFTTDGKYVNQLFVNRGGPADESVSGIALSRDPGQQFLYLSDYGNSRMVVVDRKKLEVLYQFGKRGKAPGDFEGAHHIATDSKGNLYVAEVAPGARAQKLTFKGLSATLPKNANSESGEAIVAPYR